MPLKRFLPSILFGSVLISCVTPEAKQESTQNQLPPAMKAATQSARDVARRADLSQVKETNIITLNIPSGGVIVFEDRNGIAVVDDMILGTTLELTERTTMSDGEGRYKHWNTLDIPYVIDPLYPANSNTRKIIADAIKYWEDNSVFRFHVKIFDTTDPNYKADPQFLHFLDKQYHPGDYGANPKRGCSSPVGMQKNGQVVEISEGGCLFYQTIHEIGHSLGLWHEHTRFDRDEYINVFYNRLKLPVYPDKDSADHNFFGDVSRFLTADFDFESRMLYGTQDFIGSTTRPDAAGATSPIDVKKDHILTQKDPNRPDGRPWAKQTVQLTASDFEAIGEVYGYPKAPTIDRNLLKSGSGCLVPSVKIPAGAPVPEPTAILAGYVKPTKMTEGSPFVGTALELQTCAPKPTVRYKWKILSDGTIRGFAGKCLDTAGSASADGTPVVFGMCPQKLVRVPKKLLNLPADLPEVPAPAPAASQLWKVNTNGSITGIGGKCLTVRGTSPTAGSAIEIRTCGARVIPNNQKWTVEKIAPYLPRATAVTP